MRSLHIFTCSANRLFTPYLQPILFGVLALLHLLLLLLLTFFCPTLENAALLGSLSLLLAISVLRRRHASRLSQSSYFLLGSALLTSGTTIILALCDAADWSLFGSGYDGHTGVLLALCFVVPLCLINALRLWPTASKAALTLILLTPVWAIFTLVQLDKKFNDAFPWVMPIWSLAAFGAMFLSLHRQERSLAPWPRYFITLHYTVVLLMALGTAGDLADAPLPQGLCGALILLLFSRLLNLDDIVAGLRLALLVRVGLGVGLLIILVRGIAPFFDLSTEIVIYPAFLLASLPFLFLLMRRIGELTFTSFCAILIVLSILFGTIHSTAKMPLALSPRFGLAFLLFCLFLMLLHLWQRRKLLGSLDFWIDNQPFFTKHRLHLQAALHFTLCGVTLLLIVATANQPMRLLIKNIPAIELLIPNYPTGPNPLSLPTLVMLAMHDNYLFQTQTPWQLASSDDPQLVIDHFNKGTPDHFSYFNSHEEMVNKGMISSEAPHVGRYGFAYQNFGNEWIISRVSVGSPAALAGLRRGDLLLTVDGKKIATKTRPIIKTVQPGAKVELMVKGRAGVVRKISMVATTSRKDPVFYRLLPTAQGSIGYLYLALFDDNGFSGLSPALAALSKAGIRDLVLDLRDNRGGSIALQRHLASQLLRKKYVGKELQHYRYNHKYRDMNYSDSIEATTVNLPLQRLAILTSEETCSASEALINSLKPYLAVTTIGATTCGKPMMMEVLNVETSAGENQLALVNAEIVNSRGEGGYYNGIAPTCRASDSDFQHDLGDANETLLKEALHFFKSGSCTSSTTTSVAMGKKP